MIRTKKDSTGSSLLLGFILILLALGLVRIDKTGGSRAQNEPSPAQNKMKYEGTYALYIEQNDSLVFNWITAEEQPGYIGLHDLSGNLLEESQTSAAKVHRHPSAATPESDYLLEFGALDGYRETVRIRPGEKKRESYFFYVDSIYVVGDVHGRYDQLTELLKVSGVVNDDLNWTSGKAHVVFLGDLFDRGDDVTKVLWFIYQLEQEAAEKGGKVHLVLGNHEIMTMTRDLRYLGRKEKALSIAYKTSYEQLFHPKHSLLGAWLRSKPSVLKIDDLLLAHGGIVDLGLPTIEAFNDTVHKHMGTDMFLDIMKEDPDSTKYDPLAWMDMRYFFYATDSPFWYRGYVEYDTLDEQLSDMLKKYDSKVHVVAHTPVETITEKYKGKLLTTDLHNAATEMLLLVKSRRNYKRFKVDSEGVISDVPKYVAPVIQDTLATYDPGR